MKKTIFLLAVVCILTSCVSTLPARFTRFADKVEQNCADYSDYQWEQANDKFEDLVDEYEEYYSKLKPSQKDEINKAIIRYNGIALENNASIIIEELGDIIEELPGTFNNWMNSIQDYIDGSDWEENLNSIIDEADRTVNGIKQRLDDSDLEEDFNELVEDLDRLFED